MTPKPNRPPPPFRARDGFEWQASPDNALAGEWRLIEPYASKRCRRLETVGSRESGFERIRCSNPAVAELNRERRTWAQSGSVTRPAWWAYCADHMYGRWIENGQVYEWRLRPTN